MFSAAFAELVSCNCLHHTWFYASFQFTNNHLFMSLFFLLVSLLFFNVNMKPITLMNDLVFK